MVQDGTQWSLHWRTEEQIQCDRYSQACYTQPQRRGYFFERTWRYPGKGRRRHEVLEGCEMLLTLIFNKCTSRNPLLLWKNKKENSFRNEMPSNDFKWTDVGSINISYGRSVNVSLKNKNIGTIYIYIYTWVTNLHNFYLGFIYSNLLIDEMCAVSLGFCISRPDYPNRQEKYA